MVNGASISGMRWTTQSAFGSTLKYAGIFAFAAASAALAFSSTSSAVVK